MKKLALAFAATVCFSVFGLTGCGGGGETKVIESNPDQGTGLTPEEQSSYEEDMKKQYGS